ncbi:MAG TPA: hypothetical protein VF013_10820 [Candidatus Limnocylindria bacterium]
MPWSRRPERAEPGVAPGSRRSPAPHAGPGLVATVLDPVLGPLGFAPGQVGDMEQRGQVIFCRGDLGSTDGGCVDLVIELEATPEWRVSGVRYWGFPSDRWQLPFDADSPLAEQLAGLAATLPGTLARA